MSTRDWAALTRLSNAPTVVSNMLAGAALGISAGGTLGWGRSSLAMASLLGFYAGGMALNDVMDAAHDRVHKKGRPIAQGRVRLGAASVFAWTSLGIALLMTVPLGGACVALGAALVVCIVAYNVWHKRSAWHCLWMGAVRGLVCLLAAASTGVGIESIARALLWLPAAALAAYTVFVTVVARHEDDASARAPVWPVAAMPLLGVLGLMAHGPDSWWWAGAAGLVYAVWSARSVRIAQRGGAHVGRGVMALLAGMSLLDAWHLALLDRPVWALGSAACFMLTMLGHRTIRGT